MSMHISIYGSSTDHYGFVSPACSNGGLVNSHSLEGLELAENARILGTLLAEAPGCSIPGFMQFESKSDRWMLGWEGLTPFSEKQFVILSFSIHCYYFASS